MKGDSTRTTGFEEEQIIRILREAESGRSTAAEVSHEHAISLETLRRWKPPRSATP